MRTSRKTLRASWSAATLMAAWCASISVSTSRRTSSSVFGASGTGFGLALRERGNSRAAVTRIGERAGDRDECALATAVARAKSSSALSKPVQ